MAKQKQKQQSQTAPQLEVIHFGRIWWDPSLNTARRSAVDPKGSQFKGIVDSMVMHRGFDISDPQNAVIVSPITPQQAKKAHEALTAHWENLKSNAKNSGEKSDDFKMLQVFEHVYVIGGKVQPIEYLGATGNQRSKAMIYAFETLVGCKPRGTTEPVEVISAADLNVDILVSVRTFKDEVERHWVMAKENELKTVIVKTTLEDRIESARFLIAHGYNQNAIREDFGASEGQRLYGLVTVDNENSALEIVKRMLLESKDPRYLNYKSYPPKDFPELVARTDKNRLEKWNAKASADKQATLMTKAEILEWFEHKEEGGSGGGGGTSLDRNKIKSIAESHPSKVARSTALYFQSGNETDFKAVLDTKDQTNAIVDLYHNVGERPSFQQLTSVLVDLVHISAVDADAFAKTIQDLARSAKHSRDAVEKAQKKAEKETVEA